MSSTHQPQPVHPRNTVPELNTSVPSAMVKSMCTERPRVGERRHPQMLQNQSVLD